MSDMKYFSQTNEETLDTTMTKLDAMFNEMWDSGVLGQSKLDQIAQMHLHTDL